ncbi:MAG: hypothetical protein IJX80_05760 [Clostridia bacterium]|nr:hypothetical protein [Clostridia bacterium]
MYCPNCMKKIPQTATKCPLCAQPTHAPSAGMATFRISCRPRLPLWMMIVQPISYFVGYKVHISVDNQNYVLKSKKKQIDVPVAIGTHQVRISSVGKKTAKAMKFAGAAMAFTGAVTGSGSTIYAGAAMEDLGNAFSDNGVAITFNPNELVPISVKLAWNGVIVEDKQP